MESVTLERGPCFGTCPVYTVTLDRAGNVRFEGRRFVADTGVATATVARAQVDSLFAELETVRYFDLADSYRSGDARLRALCDRPPHRDHRSARERPHQARRARPRLRRRAGDAFGHRDADRRGGGSEEVDREVGWRRPAPPALTFPDPADPARRLPATSPRPRRAPAPPPARRHPRGIDQGVPPRRDQVPPRRRRRLHAEPEEDSPASNRIGVPQPERRRRRSRGVSALGRM